MIALCGQGEYETFVQVHVQGRQQTAERTELGCLWVLASVRSS